jgi:hypothetical protein
MHHMSQETMHRTHKAPARTISPSACVQVPADLRELAPALILPVSVQEALLKSPPTDLSSLYEVEGIKRAVVDHYHSHILATVRF